jgi:CHASE2 domain-containing sensor protein
MTLLEKTKTGVILATIITLLAYILMINNLSLHEIDRFILDWKISLFSNYIQNQRNDIALLYIDDETLSGYPYKSPINRHFLSRLLNEIDTASPAAIGLDIIFDRATLPKDDELLQETITKLKSPLVLVKTNPRESGITSAALSWQEKYFSNNTLELSDPFLKTEANILSQSDGVVRKIKGCKIFHELPTFSCALAKYSDNKSYKNVHSDLIDWQLPNPDGTEVFFTLNIPRPKQVNSINQEILPKYILNILKNRIVLVGAMISGSDWHRIPLTIRSGKEYPGIYVHAQMLSQLIDGRNIGNTNIFLTLFILFATSFTLYISLETIGKKHPAILLKLFVTSFIVFSGFYIYKLYKINLPSDGLAVVWILNSSLSKYTTRLAEYYFNTKKAGIL